MQLFLSNANAQLLIALHRTKEIQRLSMSNVILLISKEEISNTLLHCCNIHYTMQFFPSNVQLLIALHRIKLYHEIQRFHDTV